MLFECAMPVAVLPQLRGPSSGTTPMAASESLLAGQRLGDGIPCNLHTVFCNDLAQCSATTCSGVLQRSDPVFCNDLIRCSAATRSSPSQSPAKFGLVHTCLLEGCWFALRLELAVRSGRRYLPLASREATRWFRDTFWLVASSTSLRWVSGNTRTTNGPSRPCRPAAGAESRRWPTCP